MEELFKLEKIMHADTNGCVNTFRKRECLTLHWPVQTHGINIFVDSHLLLD